MKKKTKWLQWPGTEHDCCDYPHEDHDTLEGRFFPHVKKAYECPCDCHLDADCK